MMRFQDIQLTDETTRQQFIQYMKSGQYSAAFALITNNTVLAPRTTTAELLNGLTDDVVQVENLNDPDFKKYRWPLATTPPADLGTGFIYLKIDNE